MLMKTALLTAALLATSQSAIAHGGDFRGARVIDIEPSLSIAVGSLYRDGFRLVYDLGGRRHAGYSDYAPPAYVVVPPVRQVVRVVHEDHRHGGRHPKHGHGGWSEDWRDDDRHGGRHSNRRWEDRHDHR